MYHYTDRIGFLKIRNRSHAAAVRQRNDRDDEDRRSAEFLSCRVSQRKQFRAEAAQQISLARNGHVDEPRKERTDNATLRDTEPERGTIRTSGARGVCASTANFTQRASSTISCLSILVAPTRRACPAPGRPSLSRFFISAYRYVFSSPLFSIQFRPACLGRLYMYHTRYSIFSITLFLLYSCFLCVDRFSIFLLSPPTLPRPPPRPFLVLVLLTISALVCFTLTGRCISCVPFLPRFA